MKNSQSAVKEPLLKGIERESYDLTHWSMQAGAIGSLQTISCIPVIAGDSIEIDLNAVFRLSPLRRQLYLDTMVDLFAFYVPHRHVYGSDWTTFIKSGTDEAVTFGTDTMPAVQSQCFGLKVPASAALPRWLTRGLVLIWNRYFRDPSDTAGELAVDYFVNLSAASPRWNWGIPCLHTKTITTATLDSTVATTDYRFALVDTDKIDLLLLDAQKGRLRSELARDYYALERYTDILNHSWGSSANTDADQRPTLLMHTSQWASGYDVDGTDNATLGTYSGKAQAVLHLKMPMKFMPEHGAIWILALARFPFVHIDETHFLALKSQPTFLEIAGDPDLLARQSPKTANLNEFFVGAGSVDLGEIPYGQWYRTHPSFVNEYYGVVDGHPFIDTVATTRLTHLYIEDTLYDDVFQSSQLKHWNMQAHVGVTALRYVPDPQKSIFAGVGQN